MRKAHGKCRVLGVLVLAVLLGLLLAAGWAGAVTRTPFTTVLEPDWDHPAWDDGYEWWTNMGMTQHNRDLVIVLWWQSSDPRVTGDSVTKRRIEGHWIYGTKTWQEQEEGTATLGVEGPEGPGVWESSYTAEYAYRVSDPIVETFVVRGVGRGVSGSVAGLRFEFTLVQNPEGLITGSGYIIEP